MNTPRSHFFRLRVKLIFVGLLLLNAGSYLSAQDVQQLKSKLAAAGSAGARLPLLQELVDAYWDSDSETAHTYLDQLIREATRNNQPEYMGYGQERRGGIAYVSGQLDSARMYYHRAFSHYQEAALPVKALKVKTRIGIMHSIQGNYAEAESIYRDVLTHSRGLDEVNAFAWNQMGTLYHYQGQADSATIYYEKSAATYQILEDTSGMLRPMYNHAVLLNELGQNEKGVSILLKVKAFQEQLGNTNDLILTTHALSDHFRTQGDLKLALDYARASYEYAQQLGHENRKISALISLARISSSNRDTSTSIQYLQEGLALARTTSNIHQVQTLLYYLGNIYLEQGEYQKSITTVQEGLDLMSERQDSRILPYLLTTKGASLIGTGSYREAREILQQASVLSDNFQNHETAGIARQLLADCYLREGQPLRAFEIAREAYERHHPYVQVAVNLELAATLHASAKALRRWEEALHYHELYKSLHDSINNTEKVRQLTIESRDFAFQLEKQKLEADQQKREAVLLEQALRNRIIAISIAALSAVLLGFFWQSRRKNRIISEKNDQLAQLNLTKDRLFAIIGHDLRKPAIAFRGIARKVNFLLRKQDFDTLNALGDHIEDNALALNQLTDNLLHWALSQKDILNVHPESFVLAPEIASVINLFDAPAQRKRIQINTVLPEQIHVFADRDSLHTIIRNLLDNAIKFTPENGNVTVEARSVDHRLTEIQISDSGIGMSVEQQERLFDLHREKSTAGTDGEKGTGLGLHLVHELVRLNNGSIHVNSSPGTGTVFTLLLPASMTNSLHITDRS